MKNAMKKAMTVCLVAALALSAFGCSKKDKDKDLPVETISLEQTKQDLTFEFSKNANKGTEPVQDPTAPATTAADKASSTAATTAAGNAASTTAAASKRYEEVTQAMNVTDAEGHGVTDAAGQSVTEWVVVETREIQTQPQQDATEAQQTPVTEAPPAPAPTPAPETEAAYTPTYDTCKAYWLDMSKQEDYFFNGEFLTITFEVNKDIPDGNYPVSIATTDIASWDLVKYDPVCINGEIAVGGTPAEQDAISDKDFCLKVNSAAAKQGEIVTMTIDLANNPGFCAFVLDIQYDSSAMTIVEAEGGKDFDAAINVAG